MKITITSKHLEAVRRRRRIIFQDDVMCPGMPFQAKEIDPSQLETAIYYHMSRLETEGSQIDSIWFEWGEGNIAAWPGKVLPPAPCYLPKWWEAGIDPVQVLLAESRKRGKEVFFSYRINGSDNEYPDSDFKLPMKEEHPDWLLHPFPELVQKHWNFAVKEVRDNRVEVLREIAENYDFDGIQIDFARIPAMFPEGHQWENRDLLTDFMRRVRYMMLEVEGKRDRPFLLAARIPENIVGCHFDGMDVETWVREQLVDIFVLGCRSSDVEVEEFRRITAGTEIKLYPTWDEHHASDGYHEASIEVWRGVYANWWRQGADGVHTFNLIYPKPQGEDEEKLKYGEYARRGIYNPYTQHTKDRWEVLCQINREIGSPETLRYRDKIFFVQRRGGGHGRTVVPNPEDWSTPRNMYFNTNMFAPLPEVLANDGRADTLVTLKVADDVHAETEKIKEISLRIALTDPAAEELSEGERLEKVVIGNFAHPDRYYWNTPAAKGIEKQIEARINNILLGEACVEEGWLVFPVESRQLAVGDNLVGVRINQRAPDVRNRIVLERIELHIRYR